MATGKERVKSLDELRVYAPSRGNLAYQSEAIPHVRTAEPAPDRPIRKPDLRPVAPRPRRRSLFELLRDYKILPKIAAVAAILAVAGVLIVTVSGYNRISAAKRENNKLSKKVIEMEKAVEKAKVDLLFSIDQEAAQEAAQEAGMQYSGIGNPNP